MKALIICIAIVVGLLVLLLVAGLLTPKKHTARCRVTLHKSPAAVWDVLADLERWPEWNPQVERMERQADRDGHPLWLAVGAWGGLPTEVTAAEPPRLLQMAVDAGSFRGAWKYELQGGDGTTELTITEEGEVDNPLFRGMMLFKGNYATMKSFARALGQKFGETGEAEVVP